LCYLKLKDEASRRMVLEKLVVGLPGSDRDGGKGRPILDELTDFDPAKLMRRTWCMRSSAALAGRLKPSSPCSRHTLRKSAGHHRQPAGGQLQPKIARRHRGRSPESEHDGRIQKSQLPIGITGVSQNNRRWLASCIPARATVAGAYPGGSGMAELPQPSKACKL